jgi:hypothetical protein
MPVVSGGEAGLLAVVVGLPFMPKASKPTTTTAAITAPRIQPEPSPEFS